MKLLNNKIAFLVINLCLILGILLLIFLIVQKQNNYKTIVTDAAAENIDIVGVNIEFRDSAQFKAGNLINSPQVGAKIFIHGYFGELSKTDKVYSGLMKVYVNGKEIFKLPVTNQKDDGNLLGISASWTVPQGMSEIAATFEVTSAQDINPKNNILQAAYNSSQKPDIAAYAIDFRPAEYASPTKSISSPVPGQKVYIYANIGELTGTGHPYFGDIDIFIDGKKAHTYTLSTIEAGNIYSAWTQWTVANKPTKIKMVFDASNKLAEVNENNNTFEFTYDPSKKMDLKLTSIEFRSSSEFGTGHKYNPAELTPGMNVYVHAYYQETNTGYGYYTINGILIDNAERAQSQVFRPDKAGNQYIYKKWRVTKGKHTILAAIDAIESVKESNENNNAGLVEINVENKSLSCLSMDSNDDQKLTIVDFRDFSKVYGLKCQNPAAWTQLCSSVDSNNDGSVGIVDFRNFSRFYGKASCK